MNAAGKLFRSRLMMTVLLLGALGSAFCQESLPRYFSHPKHEDKFGVIAPWYEGLNGQCDLRVRIAAETMKRYPWAAPKTGPPAPEYIYNGLWAVNSNDVISARPMNAWQNGDMPQRAAYAILGWVEYYRYSGDPAAIAHISMIADAVLLQCQTGADHPWPRFLISVPNKGEPYGAADPHGMIQLDLVGFFGTALLKGYQLTGRQDWLAAARHWAELLASKRNRDPKLPPWNRYANPEDVWWNDLQTGGVIMLLQFFDELSRADGGKTPKETIEARDAGRSYVRDVLLPKWLTHDTWGREYWDWVHDVQGESYSEMVPRYMMAHEDLFPMWRTDARNIPTLFIHRATVSPKSNAGVFSGAWAYPEGSQCCRRSLSYAPMQVGAALAEYGVRASSAWARELARRQFILATYDAEENGRVDDSIDGGQVEAGGWFQIAHALPLKYVLDGIAWLPAELGANRENHVVRSGATVTNIVYAKGRIDYATFDAPAETIDVLRLAFRPSEVKAGTKTLKQLPALDANGFTVEPLGNGDCLLHVRHDGLNQVRVTGDDPQEGLGPEGLSFSGDWERRRAAGTQTSSPVAMKAGSEMKCLFVGNQVRVIGNVSPSGGLADVYIDDRKQRWGIDFWNALSLSRHILFSVSGLTNGPHTLRLVAGGTKNALSLGTEVSVMAVQFSAARGEAAYGEGSGSGDTQRWILGYPDRTDFTDSQGLSWRPGTEVIVRAGELTDAVAASWYTQARRQQISGTSDSALYSHGIHAKEFTAVFTVRPGLYHTRIKLMETRAVDPGARALNISINGKTVIEGVDIASTAAGVPVASGKRTAEQNRVGLNTAVDFVFNGIKPDHGVIWIRFSGHGTAEAVASAIEVGPGLDEKGHEPKCLPGD